MRNLLLPLLTAAVSLLSIFLFETHWNRPTRVEMASAAASPLLKCLVVNPSGGTLPTASVIFAHGLGDSGAGWIDVARMLSERPRLRHVRFLLPNAPIVPVTLNGGMRMPSWFDITSLEDVSGSEDEAGLTKSAEALKALVAAEATGTGPDAPSSVKIPSHRVVVGGFSQGGAISYLAGLSFHAKDKKPLAGVVAMSTWCPMRKTVSKWLQDSNGPSSSPPPPFFAAHGSADPVVRYSFGERSVEFLKEGLGFGGLRQISDGEHKDRWTGVQFKTYQGMPHSACPEEIEDLGIFLEKVIPAV